LLFANFGIKGGTLELYDSSVAFGFEVPLGASGENRRNFKSATLAAIPNRVLKGVLIWFVKPSIESSGRGFTSVIAVANVQRSCADYRITVAHSEAALRQRLWRERLRTAINGQLSTDRHCEGIALSFK
jgi:hypothetical protein